MNGREDADRIARICARAHEALSIGFARMSLGACHCTYPDGRKRYVTPEGKPVHVCGR